MSKFLVMQVDQQEVEIIEVAAEIRGLSTSDFVVMAIMEAVGNALAVHAQDADNKLVTNVSFTPLEISLIEYAAGCNGLGVDEEAEGRLAEFIHWAVMEAVGDAVDETPDKSSAYSPLVVSVQARQCDRELFEKAAAKCGVSLDVFVLRSAYYTARELLEA